MIRYPFIAMWPPLPRWADLFDRGHVGTKSAPDDYRIQCAYVVDTQAACVDMQRKAGRDVRHRGSGTSKLNAVGVSATVVSIITDIG